MGPVLGAEGVKDVAHYVMSLSGGAADSIRAARGKEIFAKICIACHGPTARATRRSARPT